MIALLCNLEVTPDIVHEVFDEPLQSKCLLN